MNKANFKNFGSIDNDRGELGTNADVNKILDAGGLTQKIIARLKEGRMPDDILAFLQANEIIGVVGKLYDRGEDSHLKELYITILDLKKNMKSEYGEGIVNHQNTNGEIYRHYIEIIEFFVETIFYEGQYN